MRNIVKIKNLRLIEAKQDTENFKQWLEQEWGDEAQSIHR